MTAMAERGQAKWSVLGFEGSTHGNHTSFSLSPFRGSPKLPTLNWPVLEYPKSQQDAATLDKINQTLKSQR